MILSTSVFYYRACAWVWSRESLSRAPDQPSGTQWLPPPKILPHPNQFFYWNFKYFLSILPCLKTTLNILIKKLFNLFFFFIRRDCISKSKCPFEVTKGITQQWRSKTLSCESSEITNRFSAIDTVFKQSPSFESYISLWWPIRP